MAGKIKQMIDVIIEKRSKGVSGLIYTTKAKLLIKGIDADAYGDGSEDDPEIITKLTAIAGELGVNIGNAR